MTTVKWSATKATAWNKATNVYDAAYSKSAASRSSKQRCMSSNCVGVPQALEHKLAREPWGVGGVFGGGGIGGGWAHPCAILAQAGVTASPPPGVRKIIAHPPALKETQPKVEVQRAIACPRTAPFSQKAGQTTRPRIQHVPGQPPSPRRQGEPRVPESRTCPPRRPRSSPDGPLLPEGWANPATPRLDRQEAAQPKQRSRPDSPVSQQARLSTCAA